MDICLCFQHPCNIMIAGPTGCGKTYFLHRVLFHKLIDPMPTRIVLVYQEDQPMYAQWREWYPQLEMIHGWQENLDEMFKSSETNLLILDDQMGAAGKSEELKTLFTMVSHHRNLTVIYLVQNIFDQGKSMRTVSLNAQYFVLFRNPRDVEQLHRLGSQMFEDKKQIISKVMNQIDDESGSYLIAMTKPRHKEYTRLYTGIFPNEELRFYTMMVYKDKKNKQPAKDKIAECRVVNLIEI